MNSLAESNRNTEMLKMNHLRKGRFARRGSHSKVFGAS